MNTLLIVSHKNDWPFQIAGLEVIPAYVYMSDASYADRPGIRLLNLCNSYDYQSRGYYVSILAEAREQQPLPDVKAIEDISSEGIIHMLAKELDGFMGPALSNLESDSFELNCYFGHTEDFQYATLAERLFSVLRIPMLRAVFNRTAGKWHLQHVEPLALNDLRRNEEQFVAHVTADYVEAPRLHRNSTSSKPTLAILRSMDSLVVPSNPQAIEKFQEAAESLGMHTEVLAYPAADKVMQFDGLFIRDTTNPHHYTYEVARQASLNGMVVMDDPESILKCNNKVYISELLSRYQLPMPKSMLIQNDNADQIIADLGLPCILKRPDGSFSIGVEKAESKEELQSILSTMFEASDMILAQEYLPTEFDWRIGILDRRPLFVCKYFMAPGHWQIIRHDGKKEIEEGLTQALEISEVPDQVIQVALKAANLVGDGFYGVDIKQRGSQCYIIEVNDNPNVDAGNEDGILKDALYREIMGVFKKRIDARKASMT
jgi:glutathione synthase/RimK-type ligase-like ATP-grasp enzyme